jgi:hypothetical protein
METNTKIALGFLIGGTVLYLSTKPEPKRTQAQLIAGDTESLKDLSKVFILGGAIGFLYQTFKKK